MAACISNPSTPVTTYIALFDAITACTSLELEQRQDLQARCLAMSGRSTGIGLAHELREHVMAAHDDACAITDDRSILGADRARTIGEADVRL